MNNAYLRSIYLRLAGLVTLTVLVALVANAFLSHRTFERALAPQLANKLVSVGASIRALVLRAVENGVPFERLYGVNERFADVRNEMPEVSYIAIADVQGRILYESKATPPAVAEHARQPDMRALLDGRSDTASPVERVGQLFIVSLPMVAGKQPLGVLHMGVDAGFVDSIVLDMLLDVAVVLVVALFFTLELLHFIAGARLDASLHEVGETFERGAAGHFVLRARAQGEQAFAGLVKALDAALIRLNDAYDALGRELRDSRNVPAHERHPGIAQAQEGAAALLKKYSFGRIDRPVQRGEDQLAKVRAPLFMFMLAEELTRSFLPNYVGELLVPVPGLSTQVLIGLPIALFMLIVAIGQPFLGVYCERVGHRRTMLIGAGLATAGLLASALAVSVFDLLLWRALCAVGYAMVFVAGQAYVLDFATPAQRPRSFALFVGAIMAATVCGPSIGGILADNVGHRVSLAVAALMAALAIVIIRRLPNGRVEIAGRPPARIPTLREIGRLMRNRRFMTVTGLAAMPAKILLTGVCFYLVPLHVIASGSTQSMVGRLLMAYAVMMVLLAPLAASLATTRRRMNGLVGIGLLLSGLGGMLALAGTGLGWILATVVLIGIGQALSISAQSALVAEHCADEVARLGDGVVYGVYRLLERIGNALGPIVAALLVTWLDYRASFAAIGVAVALCGLLFMLATRGQATRRPVPAPERVPVTP